MQIAFSVGANIATKRIHLWIIYARANSIVARVFVACRHRAFGRYNAIRDVASETGRFAHIYARWLRLGERSEPRSELRQSRVFDKCGSFQLMASS